MAPKTKLDENMEALFEGTERLDKDLKEALRTGTLKMSREDVRYLVDLYYQIQEFRKAAGNQTKAADKSEEPNRLVNWVKRQMETLEAQIKLAMSAWTDSHPVAAWAKSQKGIGPVIAAGFSAHIDITRVETFGQIWRFAGQDPTCKWIGRKKAEAIVKEAAGKASGKIDTETTWKVARALSAAMGTKPERIRDWAAGYGGHTIANYVRAGARKPFNAKLKVLCWKLGDSFVKFHNYEDCFYGQLYAQRKALEVKRNAEGAFAAQAVEKLETTNIRDKALREKYEQGLLPDGRIDLRARRVPVKIFLSHWFEVAYWNHYKRQPPKPYVLEHEGHAHRIEIPNFDPADIV